MDLFSVRLIGQSHGLCREQRSKEHNLSDVSSMSWVPVSPPPGSSSPGSSLGSSSSSFLSSSSSSSAGESLMSSRQWSSGISSRRCEVSGDLHDRNVLVSKSAAGLGVVQPWLPTGWHRGCGATHSGFSGDRQASGSSLVAPVPSKPSSNSSGSKNRVFIFPAGIRTVLFQPLYDLSIRQPLVDGEP